MSQVEHQLQKLVDKRPAILLALIIISGMLMQGTLVATKTSISHDETISYLSAIGRQGEFERILRDEAYPASQWVSVREWKEWFTIDRPFSFQQIGLDLAESDIHPPFYFWALHVWTWLWGVHAWTGPTLNMVFQAVGAVGLFMLGRRTLQKNFEAMAVVFIWLVSPANLNAVLEARQYTLFGVCAIFFIWLIAILSDKSSPRNWFIWLLLVIGTAAGALTHYHFALIVLVAGLVFMLKLMRRDLRRLLWIGTAVVAGYMLSFILHPRFYESVQELSRRQALEVKFLSGPLEFAQRFYLVGKTFTGYWTIFGVVQVALFCLFLATIIWAGMVLVRNPQRIKQIIQVNNFDGYEVALFFVCLAGLSILLYLTYVSPFHAMSARHMSIVWPFYPFLFVILLRLVNRSQRYRITIISGIFVLLSSSFMIWQALKAENDFAWNDVVYSDDIEKFVVDGVYQGILPRTFFQLPDDALIYAAGQDQLLAEPEAWLPMMGTTAVYISELSYDNTEAKRDMILELLSERFLVVTRPGENQGVGEPYFLEPMN